MSLLDLGPDSLRVSSYLDLKAKVSTAGRAGFIFDRYGNTSFKFAAIDAVTDQVIIGHYTAKSGWVSDAVVSKIINAGTYYTLGVTLKGSTVSVTLDGQTVLGHSFNAATVDGNFGLLATGSIASFDDVRVRTDDPAFRTLLASAQADEAVAGDGSTLTAENLHAIVNAAIGRLGNAYALTADQRALLEGVNVQIADLGGLILGETIGTTVLIDQDAAGYGWFIDGTPLDDAEFNRLGENGELAAGTGSAAAGDMDLLTVVMHELGHVLGYGDVDAGSENVMSATLDDGVRYDASAKDNAAPLVVMEATDEPQHTAALLFLPGVSQRHSWLDSWLLNSADEDDTGDPNANIKLTLTAKKAA